MRLDEAAATYAELGAARVEGAFAPSWVARLLDAVDACEAALRAGTAPTQGTPTQNPPSLHATGEGGVQLRNLAPMHPAFADWLDHSPAAEIVGRVIGARHVRFWMDATFVKTGSDSEAATPWHNDGCTFPFRGEHLPSLWVALTDVSAANAPLITLAGSHRDPWRYHSPLSRQDISLEGYRPWDELVRRATAPGAPIQVWEARAGDCVLVHPSTIHASAPRQPGIPGRRVGFTTRWIGSDVVWAPDALSARIPLLEGQPDMTHGRPPPERLFPIRWRAACHGLVMAGR